MKTQHKVITGSVHIKNKPLQLLENIFFLKCPISDCKIRNNTQKMTFE